MVVFLVCVTLMQLSHGPVLHFLTLYLIDLDYSRALIGWLWGSWGRWRKIGLFVYNAVVAGEGCL